MTAPSVEYGHLSPMLIIFGAAFVGLIVETVVPRTFRYGTQIVISLAGVLVALIAVVMLAGTHGTAVMGAVAVDGPALFFQGAILLIGLVVIPLIADRRTNPFTPQGAAVPGSAAEREAGRAGFSPTEVFPLTLLALGGMLVFPAADDLLTMFIALEVLSLPLYLLCGLARRRRLLSQEAALKYFLLGAFSSAFFLYGIALLYGYAGTLSLTGIGHAVASRAGDQSMALTGVALLSVGLLFKVGAVPFHSWIPDVYQGAPTPITGLMAAATKIAAFGAMLRIFYVALPGFIRDWQPVLWIVAILTMLVAALMTIAQRDVKRMLAYSSVTNAGFILIGVIAAGNAGLSSTMFYLVAYGFSTLGAFAVLSLVGNRDGEEDTDMAHWAGLGRRSPVMAATFSLFLLAMTGMPLTSGFVSKFAVFKAAAQGGAAPLIAVGLLSSVIAAFAYARLIMLMFFSGPSGEPALLAAPSVLSAPAVGVGAAATVLLGIVPQPLLYLTNLTGPFGQ